MLGLFAMAGILDQVYPSQFPKNDDDQETSPEKPENRNVLSSAVITAVRTLRELQVDYSQMTFTTDDLDQVERDFANCKVPVHDKDYPQVCGNAEKAGAMVGAALFFSTQCEMLRVFAGQPKENALAEIFKHTLPAVEYWASAVRTTSETFRRLSETYNPLPCAANPGEGSPSFTQRMALQFVCDKVDEISRNTSRAPVVIFDLDDTLFSTDLRIRQILREFISSGECAPACAEFADILTTTPSWGFNFSFLAEARGILLEAHDEAAKKLPELGEQAKETKDRLDGELKTKLKAVDKFQSFWAARFFSNEYCQYDQPWPGAVEYVNALYAAGAEIFYVSGRSAAVESGTLTSLARYGFPLPYKYDRVHLMLKPDPAYPDDEFKRETVAGIFASGSEVPVALFENNLTHLLPILPNLPPELQVVMVGIMHRSVERGAKIPDGIMLIKDFRERNSSSQK